MVTGKSDIGGYMKTTVRTIIPDVGWSPAYQTPPQTVKTVERFGKRLCTQLKLGVNESALLRRVRAERDELFDYAMRETARTVFWEALAVGVLILSACGLCVLAVLGS
jgi:hypothetical protein